MLQTKTHFRTYAVRDLRTSLVAQVQTFAFDSYSSTNQHSNKGFSVGISLRDPNRDSALICDQMDMLGDMETIHLTGIPAYDHLINQHIYTFARVTGSDCCMHIATDAPEPDLRTCLVD